MKIEAIAKQEQDKVLEKYQPRLGYKRISQTLNIQWITIKSFINTYGTIVNA